MSTFELENYTDHNDQPPQNATGYEPLDIFRSHDVTYVEVTIPREIVSETIQALGEYGYLHIVDNSTQSTIDASKAIFGYKKRIAEVGDLEKKLSTFEAQCTAHQVPFEHCDFNINLGRFGDVQRQRNPDVVLAAQEWIQESESTLVHNLAFERHVKNEIIQRAELACVLHSASQLIPRSLTDISATVQNTQQQQQSAAQLHTASQFQVGDDDDDVNQLSSFGNYYNNNNEDGVTGFDSNPDGQLSRYICGIIPKQQIPVLTRLLYRVSRGANAVIRFDDDSFYPILHSALPIEMIEEENLKQQSIFCIATIGQELYHRVKKLCITAQATVFPVPQLDNQYIHAETTRLLSEIREQQSSLHSTQQNVVRVLTSLSSPQQLDDQIGPSPLQTWYKLLYIERMTLHALLHCSIHNAFFVLGAWVPTRRTQELMHVISPQSSSAASSPSRLNAGGSEVPLINFKAVPLDNGVNNVHPTYIPVTDFTAPFQAMFNTYGTPRYKEINPALVAIATFPFLFGVMFGDAGHGLVLLFLGLLLLSQSKTLNEQRKKKTINEMLDMVFGARFFIVMMAAMAIYCGLIYNDFMAVPMSFASSAYNSSTQKWSGVYPFGLDPAWYHKEETLKFLNSFKMKMAVIIGVTHMTGGIALNLMNLIYFNDQVSIWFEWVPRIVFLLCTFWWMNLTIIIKWCISWTDPSIAPSLIQNMINMFINPMAEIEHPLFAGQHFTQVLLLTIALICVPVLWVAKPLFEYYKLRGEFLPFLHSPADDERIERLHKHSGSGHTLDSLSTPTSGPVSPHEASVHANSIAFDSDSDGLFGNAAHTDHFASDVDDHGELPGFGEIMVNHSIHTIEYLLGTVSNTASYLRLWALSLAHAQLSEVFFSKMFSQYGFSGSVVSTIAATTMWAFATFGVIICMDALECFLHCLRLHWVESMNKHYYGDGILFQPFTFVPE